MATALLVEVLDAPEDLLDDLEDVDFWYGSVDTPGEVAQGHVLETDVDGGFSLVPSKALDKQCWSFLSAGK